MTEKVDGKEKVDRMRKMLSRLDSVVLVITFLGLAVMVLGVFAPYTSLDARGHLTDPSIPYNELENATFTWTAAELKDRLNQSLTVVVIGAGVAFVGIGTSIFVPGRMTRHKTFCEAPGVGRYCSECGVQLIDDKGKRRDN